MSGQIRRLSDEELALAERFRRGDETVLREVYDRYGGLVHRVGLACLASHHEAEDVTQATFVAAWRGRETYDPGRGDAGRVAAGDRGGGRDDGRLREQPEPAGPRTRRRS